MIQELRYNSKRFNIIIIGIPEAVERENGAEKIFEVIVDKTFPKFIQVF